LKKSKLKLFSHHESGHSYKVKLALSVGGIDHEYVAVDIFLPRDQRPADFQSAAQFGEVPVLVVDGVSHVQSNAILILLAERFGVFGGESSEVMAKVREWLFWESNRLGFSLPHLRFARKFAPQDYPKDMLRWIQNRFEADIS
jgi:glutathione S-transferase